MLKQCPPASGVALQTLLDRLQRWLQDVRRRRYRIHHGCGVEAGGRRPSGRAGRGIHPRRSARRSVSPLLSWWRKGLRSPSVSVRGWSYPWAGSSAYRWRSASMSEWIRLGGRSSKRLSASCAAERFMQTFSSATLSPHVSREDCLGCLTSSATASAVSQLSVPGASRALLPDGEHPCRLPHGKRPPRR